MTAYESWAALLHPEFVKSRVLSAGIFLIAYELLVEALTVPLHDFFSTEWTSDRGWRESAAYVKEVRGRDPKRKDDALRGSIEWLFEHKVIALEDRSEIQSLARARNIYAHRLPKVLTGSEELDFESLYPRIRELILKVERWWAMSDELEIVSLSDTPEGEANLDEIMPGRVLILDVLAQTALGNDDDAWEFYRRFCSEAGINP